MSRRLFTGGPLGLHAPWMDWGFPDQLKAPTKRQIISIVDGMDESVRMLWRLCGPGGLACTVLPSWVLSQYRKR